ncbi:MAG: hypothetical protein HEQ23_08310 [Tepidisphaera sp.]
MNVRIIDAWNGWYHLNGNTYGTWIRGDERGWRARHHREHVDGDYHNPPDPSEHIAQRAFSKAHTKTPVLLSPEARLVACHELVASLIHQRIEVIACAIDDHHFHLLARFILPPKPTGSNPWECGTHNQPLYAYIRHVTGLAKSRSSRAVSSLHLTPEGGVWAKRFKITPITDRAHQLNAFNYITDHAARSAALWTYKDPPPTSRLVPTPQPP